MFTADVTLINDHSCISSDLTPEADGCGEVLGPGLVRLHSGGVVVEGFPLGSVAVPGQIVCRYIVTLCVWLLPVESRGLDVHVEVVPHPVHHVGEGGAQLLPVPLVVCDEVTVPVPQFPQLVLRHAAGLQLPQQLGVQAQVRGGAEQVRHDDHVTRRVHAVILPRKDKVGIGTLLCILQEIN